MTEEIKEEQEGDERVYKLIVSEKMVCGARTTGYSYLGDITTTKGEEGKGYGKKLLMYIEKIAREHNEKNMETTEIDLCDYKAISFFKSMSYTFSPIAGDTRKFIKATKDLNAPNEEDNQDCLEEARNNLLQHYSSKSTNQTVILLGLAIAFFTAIQAYSALDFLLRWEKIAFLVSTLAIIIFLLIRQVGRLICWGELATASVIVEILDRDTVIRAMNESMKDDPVHTAYPESADVKYATTYLRRLSFATSRYLNCRTKQCKDAPLLCKGTPLLVYRLTSWKWFKWIYSVIAIAVLIVVVWQFYPFSSVCPVFFCSTLSTVL